MTRAQSELRTKWVFAALVLCLILVFNDYLEDNAEWLRWFALLGVFVAMTGESRSRSEMREEVSARLSGLVVSAPWLKVWFAFWAVVFFTAAVYVTRNSIDLFNMAGGFKFLLISFSVLVGPVIVLRQRQRFKELGESGDAI